MSEKNSKGRRVLNATSGLGIRKNGLTIKTCNLIFWTIVIPTLTFGCELWQINDKDGESIHNFQKFAGRRLQRFPKRSPSSTSFYGLGWLRIETYIEIKKLLFLLTLIRAGNANRIGVIYQARFNTYVRQLDEGRQNKHNSPIYELLNTGIKFGLFELIVEMSIGNTPIIPKGKWSAMVWRIAWQLDDMYWKSTAMMHNKNDLLTKTMGKSQYLTWWHIADNLPQMQRMCETMAKLVCHASRLKEDDFRLIGSSHSDRTCTECEHNAIESIKHVVMECPNNEGLKADMLNEIAEYNKDFEQVCKDQPEHLFPWLMGKPIDDIELEAMNQIWIIAGFHICKMYNNRLRNRVGVG